MPRNEAERHRVSEGRVDPRIDPGYAATALGSMVDRSAYVWNVLDEPGDFEQGVRQPTMLYLDALRIEPSP